MQPGPDKLRGVPLLAPAEKSAATFYNRHGDWFGWGCVGVTGLGLCVSYFRNGVT
jgi:apolipoprotein N-acyltransferase